LDKQSETLDAGNVKLAYHGFVEKVIEKLFILILFVHYFIFIVIKFLIGRSKRKRKITGRK